MSVMQQLKDTAGQGPVDFPRLPVLAARKVWEKTPDVMVPVGWLGNQNKQARSIH